MRINPINNYQINRNQNVQAKTKSNPKFKGIKLVLDKADPIIASQLKRTSPDALKNIEARLSSVCRYINYFVPNTLKDIEAKINYEITEDSIILYRPVCGGHDSTTNFDVINFFANTNGYDNYLGQIRVKQENNNKNYFSLEDAITLFSKCNFNTEDLKTFINNVIEDLPEHKDFIERQEKKAYDNMEILDGTCPI